MGNCFGNHNKHDRYKEYINNLYQKCTIIDQSNLYQLCSDILFILNNRKSSNRLIKKTYDDIKTIKEFDKFIIKTYNLNILNNIENSRNCRVNIMPSNELYRKETYNIFNNKYINLLPKHNSAYDLFIDLIKLRFNYTKKRYPCIDIMFTQHNYYIFNYCMLKLIFNVNKTNNETTRPFNDNIVFISEKSDSSNSSCNHDSIIASLDESEHDDIQLINSNHTFFEENCV